MASVPGREEVARAVRAARFSWHPREPVEPGFDEHVADAVTALFLRDAIPELGYRWPDGYVADSPYPSLESLLANRSSDSTPVRRRTVRLETDWQEGP